MYIILQTGKKYIVAKRAIGENKYFFSIATCDHETHARLICDALNQQG